MILNDGWFMVRGECKLAGFMKFVGMTGTNTVSNNHQNGVI